MDECVPLRTSRRWQGQASERLLPRFTADWFRDSGTGHPRAGHTAVGDLSIPEGECTALERAGGARTRGGRDAM